jgi:hypothetical protein
LLLFTSPLCTACRAWRGILPGLAEGRFDALWEIDAAEDSAAVHEWQIFHLPALLVFVDGEYHGALQATPATFAEALDSLLAKPAHEAP